MTAADASDPTDADLVASFTADLGDDDAMAQTNALLSTARLTDAFDERMRLAAAELADRNATTGHEPPE